MQNSFDGFLRHGGDGQYQITHRQGHQVGRRIGLSGQDYIGLKGHDVEQIDDIIANPRPDLSGLIEGRGRYRGQDMTLLTGQDGHWVVLDPGGNVVAVSNRNLPPGHDEK